MTWSSSFQGAAVLGVDFETVYKKKVYDVKSFGYYGYTHDPRFCCYLAGFGTAEGTSSARNPKDVTPADWSALAEIPLWVSHNAAFDQAVFLRLQELGLVPAGLWPRRWLCTGALAGYIQAPRDLQAAAKAVLNVDIDKGYRVASNGYTPGSDMFLEEQLAAACAIDAVTCARLWEAREAEWPEHERQLWEQTVECGRAGVMLDAAFVAGCLDELNKRQVSYTALLPWTKPPYRKTPASTAGLGQCCAAAGIPPPDSTEEGCPELDRWIRVYGNTKAAEWVRHLQGFRKTAKKIALFESMLRRTDPATGRMDFELMYCGSDATGRWAGSNGLNMQNLNRDEKGGTTNPRQAFIPAPGKSFVIADLAQIEPRVLAWVVDDQALLEMVRRGVNIYEAHARTTMGWTGGKLKNENDRLYSLAKVRVIQLGYQSWADTFKQACMDYAALEITQEEAERQVMDYRRANPKVVTLWGRMENAMAACEGGIYTMPLPSGRMCRYFNVHKAKGKRGDVLKAATIYGEQSWEFYGGLLTENLVQSIARDVFASALLRIESEGYKIVWHVHDEVIVEVADEEAEAAKARVLELMSVTPGWIPGLPVGAEVKITKHYVK